MKLSVIGLDEVGRGPLSGPVVSAAVRIKNKKSDILNSKLGINDSKKISPKKRISLHNIFISHPDIEWGTGVVSQEEIDRINILEATKLSMKIALESFDLDNSVLIIDGNFYLNVDCKQNSVIRGDEIILECSIASIIAKVTRDNIMCEYHEKYPLYKFNKNKGYGTKEHREAVKKYGVCDIHRKSFRIKK